MCPKVVALLGALAVALGLPPAGVQETTGQSAPHQQTASGPALWEQCSANDQTDAAERLALEKYSSPALEKAFLSSKSFWNFITDPATPYVDRMAAADRGGSMLSPQELALLWTAMAEVRSVPSGVGPPPCSAVAMIPLASNLNSRRDGSYRVVLGRRVKLPEVIAGFPITAEERNHSPWLWQLEKALSVLFDKVNIYYGDPDRYPARVKAAWDWPVHASAYQPGENPHDLQPAEWNKIEIRSRALTGSAPHDTLLLQTILKLALNNDNYYVAYSAHVEDLYASGQDSYHYEELAHVAQIAILQKTRWENVAERTAFVMESLATWKGDAMSVPNVHALKTATGVRAIGRWAMDKSLDPWNRYYSFAQPICRMVDDAPCPADQLREPSDPRLDQSRKMFDAWFESKTPELERQAKSERPHLDSLANELRIAIE